jgi:hypothetical protein
MILQSVFGQSIASAVASMGGLQQPPASGASVGQRPATLSEARKFLEGRWTLESFEVFPPGKPPITLKGQGTLTYDDFGSMRIEIRADEQASDLLRAAGVEIRDGTISSDGRTVLDLQNRTISYVLPGQTVGAPAPGPLSPARLRHWEIKDDLLILSTKDDAGKVLSTGRWRRMR